MDRRKVGRPTSWRPASRQGGPRTNIAKLPTSENRASENRVGTFDQWLDHRLKEMYGAVVEEPLPKELRELVERLSEEDDVQKVEADENDRNK